MEKIYKKELPDGSIRLSSYYSEGGFKLLPLTDK